MPRTYFFSKLRLSFIKSLRPLCVAGIVASTALVALPVQAQDEIMIPDIGIAGSLGMTLQKEMALGEYFMRTARSQLRVLDDPVMLEYVSTLGNKLLSHADHVNFPFEFFLVLDPNLNASAFLGGKVAINTGLFTYANTEDEFASVIAHEISHVTQRHLARFMERMASYNQLSAGSIIGAIVLGILNPAMGMAAASTYMGMSAQTRINFTRDNEYEADRIGIDLLYRAGFSPSGMVEMFRHLFAMQGNINPAFTLLIDHPLSDERMAEAVNRAAQLPQRKLSSSPDYSFAKARVAVRYGTAKEEADFKDLKKQLQYNIDKQNAHYQNYALALVDYELGNYDQARHHLQKLGSDLQNNLFIVDLQTDIDLKDNKANQAIKRLERFYRRLPQNQVVVVNLATAYLAQKKVQKAQNLIEHYLRQKPEDLLALSVAADIYSQQRDKCNLLQTRGELLALQGAYSPAIGMYNKALSQCLEPLTRERIRARVGQIVSQRAFDESLVQ